MLVVAAVATNAEAFAFGDFFNLVEHGAGLMGSGVAFAFAARERRRTLLTERAEGEV
ncbi:hypothetical protein NGM07_17280 [Halorussus vallis]|nr:hypothetical protein [Halorussus vallis]USZ75173.1 hypothetical protein NGM07_17280 [Halorussus vallis]